MKSVQTGLLFLLVAAPGAFGARRATPLRSHGRAAAAQDGWIQAASEAMPLLKTNMLVHIMDDEPAPEKPEKPEDPEDEEEMKEIIDEQAPEPAKPVPGADPIPEEPEPNEPDEPGLPPPVIPAEPAPSAPAAPVTPAGFPNDYIKGVTWEGTGCPNGPGAADPSVDFITDEEGDTTTLWMDQFGVSLGLDGAYGPLEQSCSIIFDVEGVPAGHRWGFVDSRAEGNIFLEKGSIANFTTDIWWGSKEGTTAHNMKYWPNYDRDDPVNVRYMTTPYMLDSTTMAPYASQCPKEGVAFSGKLTVKFTLTMTPVNAEASPQARGLVDMLAVGLTMRVIPC